MLTLIDTRNRHFIAVAQRIVDAIPANVPVDLTSVAAQAALSPAPRYYCNFLYALRMLYVYRKSKIRLKAGRRKALWVELNEKVDRIIARCGGDVSSALSTVLAKSQASQFFISPVTAANILRRYYDYATRKFLIP